MTEDDRKARLERALALAGHTHTLSDLVTLLKRGDAQWFSNGDGMIVTEVMTYPRARLLNYWLVCGELHHCLALQEEVDEFGLREGCTHAVATGRRGWDRAAAGYGWRLRQYRYEKPLEV